MEDKIVKEEEVYTVEEAKDILKISRTQMYRMIKSGRLPAVNVGNGSQRSDWRITRKDLDQFLTK